MLIQYLQPFTPIFLSKMYYMTDPILVDDDAPRTPSPLDDALSSAQQKRFLKSLNEDSPNDYGYSD